MTLQLNHSDPSLPLGRYRHYKGREYELVALAKHADNDEPLVVYRCLYGEYGLWVRAKADFIESVELSGETIPRFAYLGPMDSSAGLKSSEL